MCTDLSVAYIFRGTCAEKILFNRFSVFFFWSLLSCVYGFLFDRSVLVHVRAVDLLPFYVRVRLTFYFVTKKWNDFKKKKHFEQKKREKKKKVNQHGTRALGRKIQKQRMRAMKTREQR